MQISNNNINIVRVKLTAAHQKAIAKKRLWKDPVNPTIIGYADTRGKLIPGSIWSGGKHITPLAQQYYDSPEGQWLHEAANIEFKGPIEPLAWVIKNKPKDELHSLSFLILAVGCGNAKVMEKIQLFEIRASAYSYLQKNIAARNDLHRVYESLMNSGVKEADISYVRMKPVINKTLFTYQNNKNKPLSDGYFKAIVKVYLYLIKDFRNMDDPNSKVEKWFEAGNDGNIK